jgi:hypothetical protein
MRLARVAMLFASLVPCACQAKLGDCQREPLEALADQLAAAEPHARPDLVHAQLPEACRLPTSMTDYLEYLRPVGTEVPGLDRRGLAVFIDRAAFGHACAAGRQIFDIQWDQEPSRRIAFVYETCELGRYELAGVEEGVPMMVYALHRWLLDQGLDAERARTISRAVMLSETRAHAWAGTYADRRLPEVPRATAVVDPVGEIVHVTASAIRYHNLLQGEREIVELRAGRIASEPSSDSAVRSLWVALGSVRATERLDIAADVGTRLETILRICNTGIEVEIHEFGLVVETQPWRRGTLPFELARPGETSDLRIDLAAPERVEQVCADGGAQLTIELVGHPNASVAELAASLAAVRAQPCVARVVLGVA